MKQIRFAFDQEHTIDSLLFTKNLTQNTLYEYVEDTIGSPVILSFDQQSVFDRNDTLLSTLFNIQSDVNVYCSLRLNLVVNIYLDGTFIGVVKSDDSVVIEDLIASQLQPLILAECQLFDIEGNIIQSYVEVKQTFSRYVQGQETVQLNLVTPKSVDPLQHLVVLKNISLWIDPDGQYVTFKFHNENMSGCLYKNKGKHPNALIGNNWITVNKVKYSIIDDYGFAVTWDDGTISQIHYY